MSKGLPIISKNSNENMEEHRETASALNEEPAIELIEESPAQVAENAEPIAAELLAVPDEPITTEIDTKPEELQLQLSHFVAEKSDSPIVLEINADPRAQFQDNCRMVAAGPVSSILKIIVLAAICTSIHVLADQPNTRGILIAALLVAILNAVQILYVRWRAHAQATTKYVLKEDLLQASGPDPSSDWTLRISLIDKAMLISGAGNSKHLVLGTRGETFVLRGLEDPEKLWNTLPQEVRVDCSALEQKLQHFADSMYECKDADQIEKFKNAKELQKCVKECLQDFPDTRVLNRDFRLIRRITIFTLVFSCITIAIALLGYPQIALPVIPIILFGYLPHLLAWRKTVNCHYVFCPDALFEIDSKRGAVNTISLNRLSIRPEIAENDGESLWIDGQLHIPVQFDKNDADYIKHCIKKYPNA